MLQLIIDGKNANLQIDATIGITLNNYIIVERKEDATYPFTLSLRANRHIFGFPDRLNNNSLPLVFPAMLKFGPYVILAGSAIVTDINEDDEIELFIKTATASFWGVNSDSYLDEIDLGREIFSSAEEMLKAFDDSLVGEYNFICTQLYDGSYNPTEYLPSYYNRYDFVNRKLLTEDKGKPNSYAPFPRLLFIIERIFKGAGYTVKYNALQLIPGFRDILIFKGYAVSGLSFEYNKMLPHISVGEFLNEIEKKFSVRIFVNEATKEVSLISAVKLKDSTDISVEILDGVTKSYEDITEEKVKNYKFLDKETEDSFLGVYKEKLSVIIGEDVDPEVLECNSTILGVHDYWENIWLGEPDVENPLSGEESGTQTPSGPEVESLMVRYKRLATDNSNPENPQLRLSVYRGLVTCGADAGKIVYAPFASPEPLADSKNQLSLVWTGGDGLYQRFHAKRIKEMDFSATHELKVVPSFSFLSLVQEVIYNNVIIRNQHYIIEKVEMELAKKRVAEYRLVAHPI